MCWGRGGGGGGAGYLGFVAGFRAPLFCQFFCVSLFSLSLLLLFVVALSSGFSPVCLLETLLSLRSLTEKLNPNGQSVFAFLN